MQCSKASRRGRFAAAVFAAAMLCSGVAPAAPHRPADDAVVLERLSAATVALRSLRGEKPTGVDAASKLPEALAAARHYVEVGQTYSDPRAYGYAQAALGTWWNADPAPPELRVMRARILQFRHDFDGALVQLEAALKADQFNPEAWLLFAGIEQVRGNVRASRAACLKLIPIADPLVGATCAASTAALGGHTQQGEQLLAGALARPTAASNGEKAWSWTALAEMRERLGDATGAQTAFRNALALVPDDVYSRAAYADLLLDLDRPHDAGALLGTDAAQADATLLRAAIAAQRSGGADAAMLRQALAERFAEARARGDETHLREQARFALELERDAARALDLARRNFAVQREPADARILLESALSAGDANSAGPALDWLRDTGVDAPRLRRLGAQLALEKAR
jgi:predicted Zn-dependent protease